MAKGADVNAKDEDEGGKTPLDIANTWGHGPAVATLRKRGGKHGTIHSAIGGGDVDPVTLSEARA